MDEYQEENEGQEKMLIISNTAYPLSIYLRSTIDELKCLVTGREHGYYCRNINIHKYGKKEKKNVLSEYNTVSLN